MDATAESHLILKLRRLSPQQFAEVEDFVDFLTANARKRAALDRLLAIAPALQDAGVDPVDEEIIANEVAAARNLGKERSAGR